MLNNKTYTRQSGMCSVLSCMDKAIIKSFCRPHYMAWKRHGDPKVKTREAKGHWDGITCKVHDCTRPAKIKAICTMHYSRDLRLKQQGLPFKYQDIKPKE